MEEQPEFRTDTGRLEPSAVDVAELDHADELVAGPRVWVDSGSAEPSGEVADVGFSESGQDLGDLCCETLPRQCDWRPPAGCLSAVALARASW